MSGLESIFKWLEKNWKRMFSTVIEDDWKYFEINSSKWNSLFFVMAEYYHIDFAIHLVYFAPWLGSSYWVLNIEYTTHNLIKYGQYSHPIKYKNRGVQVQFLFDRCLYPFEGQVIEAYFKHCFDTFEELINFILSLQEILMMILF